MTVALLTRAQRLKTSGCCASFASPGRHRPFVVLCCAVARGVNSLKKKGFWDSRVIAQIDPCEKAELLLDL